MKMSFFLSLLWLVTLSQSQAAPIQIGSDSSIKEALLNSLQNASINCTFTPASSQDNNSSLDGIKSVLKDSLSTVNVDQDKALITVSSNAFTFAGINAPLQEVLSFIVSKDFKTITQIETVINQFNEQEVNKGTLINPNLVDNVTSKAILGSYCEVTTKN